MPYDFKDIKFNLSAVNWQSVSLLEGAHLEADRIYLEEMLRCAVFFAGRSGVVSLNESDLIPGSASSQSIGVRLNRCFAITPKGYLVCWDSENQAGEVIGSADSSYAGSTLPLYLCVDAEREEAYAYPPQELRNECSFVRPCFHLSTSTANAELDALKIGQFRRSNQTNRLELDTNFIPECLRLDSHWVLKKWVTAIQSQAKLCLDSLVIQLRKGQFHLDPMASPLGSATVLVDWTASPYAYLERMLSILRTTFALQFLIKDTGVQARVYQTHEVALKYIEPSLLANTMDWALALSYIYETFRSLSGAFTGQIDSGARIHIPADRAIS